MTRSGWTICSSPWQGLAGHLEGKRIDPDHSEYRAPGEQRGFAENPVCSLCKLQYEVVLLARIYRAIRLQLRDDSSHLTRIKLRAMTYFRLGMMIAGK